MLIIRYINHMYLLTQANKSQQFPLNFIIIELFTIVSVL